jgi:hypothetical protein
VIEKWHYTFTKAENPGATIVQFVGMFAVLANVPHLQSFEGGLFVAPWKTHLVEQFRASAARATGTRSGDKLVFEGHQIETTQLSCALAIFATRLWVACGAHSKLVGTAFGVQKNAELMLTANTNMVSVLASGIESAQSVCVASWQNMLRLRVFLPLARESFQFLKCRLQIQWRLVGHGADLSTRLLLVSHA